MILTGPPDSRLYASVLADSYVGASEALLSPADGDDALVVPREVGRIVDLCGTPGTLDEHVARACSTLGTDDRASVDAIVGALVEAGLLGPLAPCSIEPRRPAGSIACIAVPTSDRPDLLDRCLTSYAAHCAVWGETPAFLVVDGSRTAAGEEATRAVCEMAVDTAGGVRYVGRDERERIRHDCIRVGFDDEIVRWLLPDPPPVYAAGATRNLMLLATAGQSVLMVDDDTICWVREHPRRASGLAFVGHADTRDSVWFSTRQASTSAGTPATVNLLATHGGLLRTRLADAAQTDAPVDMSGACKHLLRQIRGARSGRVRAVWSGIAGDAAVYCPHGTLFTQGPTRDRLAGDEALFEMALKSREVFRAVRQTTVTDEGRFMGYCASLDNRDVLPPFPPTGFNEDGLFAWMLRAADPDAFIAQLPYVIVHDSVRPSGYEHVGILSASQVRTTEVLEWLCRPWAASCVSRAPARRLRELAAFILSLADLDLEDFRAHLKRTVVEAKWQTARRCDSVGADGFRYPAFWRQALVAYKAALFESLTVPGFYVPIEWKRTVVSEGLRGFQQHLRMFGRALAVWPDLWEHCGAVGVLPVS